MSKALIPAVLCLFLSGLGYCQKHISLEAQNQPINGEYVALEKMPSVSPDDPDVKWFHENTLFVRNNEAILDMVPVSIRHGEKSYSASDGGSLTYRGRFLQKDGQTFVQLRLFQSDYIVFPAGHDPYKEIKTRGVNLVLGQIDIDGVRYRRKTLDATRSNELLRLLTEKPMDKTAR